MSTLFVTLVLKEEGVQAILITSCAEFGVVFAVGARIFTSRAGETCRSFVVAPRAAL